MPRLKTTLRVLRQTFVIIIITLVLAEIAFRVFNYVKPSFIFHDSSYNRFRGKPHEPIYGFALNSRGFNDVEFGAKKEEGAYRVLGLGDSFAFGIVPNQYNYLTLLEEGLNKDGKKVELINMGIPGIGPKDYLSLLNDEGLELEPDMVLLSFFIGNDFMRSAEERSLYTYSYVASFINYLISAPRERLVASAEYNDSDPTFSDPKFVGLESDRSEIYRKQNPSFEGDFAEAMGHLASIKKLCDERKISLALVLIPDEVQINRTLQSKVLLLKGFNASPDDFDFALPNKLMAAKLKELKIKFVDLLDSFAAESSRKALYKPNDSHWNIAGNELAARVIQEALFNTRTGGGEANQAAQVSEPSSYEGFHDETNCNSIQGWAWDTLRPNAPVNIEIYDGDTLLATVTANRLRKDLVEAGKGNGAHAFDYPVPARLKDGRPHVIRLKVAGSRKELTGTGKQINCGPE